LSIGVDLIFFKENEPFVKAPINKEQKWKEVKNRFSERIDEINLDIRKYNSMVPVTAQMYPLMLEVELAKLPKTETSV
jgi:hypothetical protein